MKKILIWSLVLLVLVAVGAWLFLGRFEVEAGWEPEWPQTIQGVGEATERILPGPDGSSTDADRERAVERARWKAYYYAQLRLAEQLGGLKIAADTVIRDAELAEQELRASYEGTIAAAREVEEESSVEISEDGVRARVVVEIPPQRLLSLKQLLVAAFKSGRITVRRAADGPSKVPSPEAVEPNAVMEDHGEEPAEVVAASETAESGDAGAAPATGTPAPRRAAPLPTGYAVHLERGAARLGAAPTFYDSRGTMLGSTLDLPLERLTAGLPIASAGEEDAIRKWAGERPRRYDATVSKGNLVLRQALEVEEARQFRKAVVEARVVLVLGREAGS